MLFSDTTDNRKISHDIHYKIITIMKRKRENDNNDSSDDSYKKSKKSKKDSKVKKEKKKKDKKKKEKKSKEKKHKKDVKPPVKESLSDETLVERKRMVPMTKEEWEKQQSVVRR